MADSKHYPAETTPSHSEEESISETYVEVKMEDVGGYSVHVDSPEKENIRPTITTEFQSTTDLVSPVSPISPKTFEEAADLMARRETQLRATSYPELCKPPPIHKSEQSTSEEKAFSERFPPVPTTEEKGKGRVFPISNRKSELKFEEAKPTFFQLQRRLFQATKTSSQLEEQLVKRITELSRLENQLYHNNNSLTETEAKLQASNLQCKTLRMKLEDATEDLKQTQEHIFRLQPQQQGITQSDASVAYTAICDGVQSWIGFHLDGALDDGHIDLGNLDKSSSHKLIKLLTPMGLKGTRFAETDESNLIAVVMEFLRSEILERELYGAIDLRDLELVRTVLKNMESLKPPRDLESRRSWRSETLGALVHSTEFDHRRKKRIQELSEELLKMLGVIDVAILNERCFESLQRNIIEPTMNLAHRLHLSMDRFRVQWSNGQPPVPTERLRGPSILEKYDCCNVLANGKPVRLDGKDKFGGEGVTYLFDIVPGFYCQSFKENSASELKVLKKPKVLVAVGKPGRREFVPLAGKGGTILGNLYDRLRSGKN